MKDMALHLRQESKRTDLPLDVIRTLCEAYAALIRLEEERDEARLEVCNFDNTRFAARQEAAKRGWDCFKIEKAL